MQEDGVSSKLSVAAATSLVVAAGMVAAGTGALVAMFVPQNQSGWVGVALIPFWFVLELFFEVLVSVFGIAGKPHRVVSGVVVVAGFYAGALLLPGVAA